MTSSLPTAMKSKPNSENSGQMTGALSFNANLAGRPNVASPMRAFVRRPTNLRAGARPAYDEAWDVQQLRDEPHSVCLASLFLPKLE